MTLTSLHDDTRHSFASDNYAGIHPDVLAALATANGGHQPPYGADDYTRRLGDVVRDHFGDTAEVYPLFNGTGANVVALSAVLPRWGAVIAPLSAHINTSEGAAPERLSGIKVIGVDTADGKLTPPQIEMEALALGDEQLAQPLAVSITQVTELGTRIRLCRSLNSARPRIASGWPSTSTAHDSGTPQPHSDNPFGNS